MIRIISLTEAGQHLGQRLALAFKDQQTDCEHWHKPKPFTKTVQDAFLQGDRLVMICATGIVVRTLAPILANKYNDPAVLVLDEAGQFVIPLLSGHEGGANAWAAEVANHLQAELVMTTAKPYTKPLYSVGMGCERGCTQAHLQGLLQSCLAQANLTIDDIADISSIDIKADEQGLIALAASLNKPFNTYDKQQLAEVGDLLSTRSDYVYSVVGVYGVAEAAALFSAQQQTQDVAELILNKQKTAKATCAIARSYFKHKG